MSLEKSSGSPAVTAAVRGSRPRGNDPTALLSGALFVILGVGFLLIGMDYDFGTARRMGAGYFPVVLAVILILLGVAVALPGLSRAGERAGPINWRGVVLIPAATLAFALLVRPAGMLIASFIAVCIASISTKHYRVPNVILVATAISIFSTLVFVVGLGLPIPIVGAWFN